MNQFLEIRTRTVDFSLNYFRFCFHTKKDANYFSHLLRYVWVIIVVIRVVFGLVDSIDLID